jgi:ABC-2 type transport system ATP-binding protein
MSNDLAIEANELTKTYPPDVRALDGLSLAVPAGTIFGLLGPNGAGKSTTVRILTTLSRPDRGSARVAGVDVLAEPVRVRHAIGVVAQRHGLDPEATGRENLTLQGEFYAITGADLRERVGAALERFALAGAADRPAKTYSGGMQRRLDLAMGLIHRPRVLFLDEPTTGLDPEARADIWHEIERLAREERMTILLTTHYLEEADQLADRVAIVSRGQVVVDGQPEELKRELHGDAIAVEVQDGEVNRAAEVVRNFDGTSEITTDGRMVRARVPNGAQAVPGLLSTLDAQGVGVASVTTARASLDDVYLHYTGRAFASEDEEGA